MSTESTAAEQGRRSFAAVSIDLFERFMPDPFILAIGLAVLVALAAALIAPRGSLPVILSSWYAGIFGILGFAFQMILILVTGHALAHSPPCMRALKRLVATVKTPNQAVVLTFLIAAAASWISWGFGLVVGGVLAREVARQLRVDFAWLVAAAYSGFVIYASGPSGSIPLSQASHGNALNIVEKVTGQIVPFGQSIFAPFNLVPMLAIVVIMPFVLLLMRPRGSDVQVFVPAPEPPAGAAPVISAPRSFARKLETSPAGTIILVAAGLGYAGIAIFNRTGDFDINFIIFLFLTAGLRAASHAHRLCRCGEERSQTDGPADAAISDLRRDHGDDDHNRFGRADLAGNRRFRHRAHAAVPQFRLVDLHFHDCSVGRRSLGGAGPFYNSGSRRVERVHSGNHNGGRHGRRSRQYASALLGPADGRHCRDRHPACARSHRDYFRGQQRNLRRRPPPADIIPVSWPGLTRPTQLRRVCAAN